MLIRQNSRTAGKTEKCHTTPHTWIMSLHSCGPPHAVELRHAQGVPARHLPSRAAQDVGCIGGAKGSGGPRGRRNGNYKHGRYTAEAKQRRLQLTLWIRNQLREANALIHRLHELTARPKKSS